MLHHIFIWLLHFNQDCYGLSCYRLLFGTCCDLNRMNVNVCVLMINDVCVCVSACSEGAVPSLLVPLSPDRSIPVGYHGSTPHQKTIAIRIEGTHSLSLCLSFSHVFSHHDVWLCLWDQGRFLHNQITSVHRGTNVRFLMLRHANVW